MLTERLQAPKRCPSAQSLGIALATGYKIIFTKKSTDESGKATLVETNNKSDIVYGVIFDINDSEREQLNKAEGTNDGGYYAEENFSVMYNNKLINGITTYIAPKYKCEDNLPIYDWYLSLIIAGAKQNNLDNTYIKNIIENNITNEDKKENRDSRIEALKILQDTGYEDIFLELK